MDVKFGTQNAIDGGHTLSTSRTETRPCMMCQYGILDIPVAGKMNCFEAGQTNIKHLSREEVEEMAFCDKMVPWAKIEVVPKKIKEESDIEIAERLLGNR